MSNVDCRVQKNTDAWERIHDLRESDCQTFSEALAPIEHYAYGKVIGSDSGLIQGLICVSVYESMKIAGYALEEFLPHTGKCPVSPPSLDSVISGFEGATAGWTERMKESAKDNEKKGSANTNRGEQDVKPDKEGDYGEIG